MTKKILQGYRSVERVHQHQSKHWQTFFLFQSNLSLIQSYLADTGSRQTEKSQSTLYIFESQKEILFENDENLNDLL